MGFRIDIGGITYEAEDWSVVEAATPLAAGDSSGQTGTIEITLPLPDKDSMHPQDPRTPLVLFGPSWLIDQSIRIKDSRKGFTLGTVSSVGRNDQTGLYTVNCRTRLGELNVYGVQAQPFIGRLEDAFAYYLSLADIDTDLYVEDAIADRPVVFPGWNGELWFYLKQMASAMDCDISLVSGIILLRPIRARVATRGRDVDRGQDVGGGTLAQSVEVYKYNSHPITNELVWPPRGWTPETEVQNVNAGEDAEYTLELSASVSSIQEPEMLEYVAESYGASSVYTVIGSDGLPVNPEMWAKNGGRVEFSINPDTVSITVKLHGATNIPTVSGTASTNFALALASDATGNRYSTLRIVGTGVGFDKVKKTVRTGVPASRTSTVVGVTIDNPFINTTDDLYRAGTRAAKSFTGYTPTLSGTVTAINRRGDTASADYPTYGEVRDYLYDELGAPTYGEVQTYTTTVLGNMNYGQDREYWFSFVRDNNVNQVFGNVQGCRIFDKKSRRWYRIRQGTLTPPNIQQFSADDDLIHADMEEYYFSRGYTYGDVQATRAGLTYREDDMAALYG